MRKRLVWFTLAAALMAALVIVDGGDAQPPGKKGGKKGGFGATTITADQIVERILSFDKNGDGKITLDELPERMQHLIALGDTNKDGALDRDEIRKLATTLEAFVGFAGGGPPDGKKGDGPKGFKGGGPKGAGGEALRALDDLNITGKTRDRADRVVKGYQDKLKKFDELSRAELVLQMKDVLSPEDHRAFKDAVDRPPPGPPGFGGPKKGPPDLERRIDQLQQELDDLRKKLSK
jgi:hypothetical protein